MVCVLGSSAVMVYRGCYVADAELPPDDRWRPVGAGAHDKVGVGLESHRASDDHLLGVDLAAHHQAVPCATVVDDSHDVVDRGLDAFCIPVGSSRS